MVKKAEKWNPGLSSGCKGSRAVGRPRKRWEDDINQFFKPEETEETKGNDLKNDDTWMQVQKTKKDGKTWEILHEEQVRKVLKFIETEGIPVNEDSSSSSHCTRGPKQLPLPTTLSPTPYECDRHMKRRGKPSTSTLAPSPQRCSRVWA